MTEEKVKEALGYVIEPDFKKDIVTLNLISDLTIDGSKVSFALAIHNPAMHNRKRMEEACLHQLQRFLGKEVEMEVSIHPIDKSPKATPATKPGIPGIKNIIAVASGKGGVGKSTVAANLAVALSKMGFKTGLVDADIYGPSVPMMFDVSQERPGVRKLGERNLMVPVENYGVKLLSIGFFAEAGQAVVWRGPMATKALNQLLNDADWGALDFMIIDLPPGTGDIHLSLVQSLPVTGAVIVSTPQEVSLIDAHKAVDMFKLPQINVPVLGLVENMSYFTPAELPNNRYYIFGKEGVKRKAEELGLPFLGEIPIVQSIRESGDAGRPAVLQVDTPQAKSFINFTVEMMKELEKRNVTLAPTTKVEITHMDGCAPK
jgi:ATP-binding protein involved in chromosome partitioning